LKASGDEAEEEALEEEEEEKEEEEEYEEDEPEKTKITLRIGVFFDGTGNNLSNAALTELCRRDDRNLLDDRALQETIIHCNRYGYRDISPDGSFKTTPNNSYGNALSNIARLFELYIDNSGETLPYDATTANIKIYIDGIGTLSGQSDSAYSQGTDTGEMGIVSRVNKSPALIKKQLDTFLINNPDKEIKLIEFDIFGFSRGAAAARHFASEVLKGKSSIFDELINPIKISNLAKDFTWQSNTIINFIGLFDTVAAVEDILALDFSPANNINPGVNLYLPPGCARKVIQLTARDEKRWNFALNSVAPDHQEIELPGVHSDIGGGYAPLMTEKLLLTKPYIAQLLPGESIEQTTAWKKTEQKRIELEKEGITENGKLQTTYWNIPVLPRGKMPNNNKNIIVTLTINRKVRGELSLVYLRAMRDLASLNNVPFKAIKENDPSLAVPDDLHFISKKIIAYALGSSNALTSTENKFLKSNYIHISSNWTPTAGFFISKPSPNRRLIYNNKPEQEN
jgi:hypothetical protein